MAVVIRKATGDDLAGVVEVGRRTWPATYEPIAGPEYVALGLAKWWTPEATIPAIRAGRVSVADLDGQVVGVVSIGARDAHLVIWKLYVLPEFQGRGIGSALLACVLDAARGSYPQVQLSFTEGNAAGERFYRSHGFTPIGREKTGDGLPDQIWMAMDLEPAQGQT